MIYERLNKHVKVMSTTYKVQSSLYKLKLANKNCHLLIEVTSSASCLLLSRWWLKLIWLSLTYAKPCSHCQTTRNFNCRWRMVSQIYLKQAQSTHLLWLKNLQLWQIQTMICSRSFWKETGITGRQAKTAAMWKKASPFLKASWLKTCTEISKRHGLVTLSTLCKSKARKLKPNVCCREGCKVAPTKMCCSKQAASIFEH